MHFEDDQAEIHKVVVGPLRTNVYVLRCKTTGEAVMIDAADDPEQLVALCRHHGVTRVLQTHGHWDHVGAVPGVHDAGYPVGVTAEDAPMLPDYDFLLEDDAVLDVGALTVRTIFTPGHTPGSMCVLVEGCSVLLGGDTLFPGGPGATRPPGDFATIIRSIDQRLFAALDDDTIVMPGHGQHTTIGAERPHLQEWVARGW